MERRWKIGRSFWRKPTENWERGIRSLLLRRIAEAGRIRE